MVFVYGKMLRGLQSVPSGLKVTILSNYFCYQEGNFSVLLKLWKRNWQLYLQILMLKYPRMPNLYVMRKRCSTLLLTFGHPPEGMVRYSEQSKDINNRQQE